MDQPKLGYTGLFEARINRITSDAQPENQVGVIVYYILPPKGLNHE